MSIEFRIGLMSETTPRNRKARRVTLENPTLRRLAERAAELERLDALLRASLPNTVGEHCRLANVRGAQLVFHVDDASVGIRLRSFQSALLALATRHLPMAPLMLNIRVVPPLPDEPTPRPNSEAERRFIERVADLLKPDTAVD